jgi:hypothetical protein
MGEVVNFRRARKKIGNQAHERQARANRTKFGRTKAQRREEDRAREKTLTHIANAKRDV